MGLGVLGGGIASAKWFVRKGAKVTVTDLRERKNLRGSIHKLGGAAKQISFVLGKHRKEDFRKNDYVVVNPAVLRESMFLNATKKAGKKLINDASIFFDEVRNPIVAVSGTRGKTTTTNWVAHFLSGGRKKITAAGNSSAIALLDLIERAKRTPNIPAVIELSSWQLEFVGQNRRGPDIAVITNLLPDHLNRYRSLTQYAEAKANIFKQQKESQHLILNAENEWTPFFLKKKPKSTIWFVSRKPLPVSKRGLFVMKGEMYFQDKGKKKKILDTKHAKVVSEKGEHNTWNFLAAALAAHLAGIPWEVIQQKIASLPAVQYREEIVMRKGNVIVVNDSAATSPDAVCAALERFGKDYEVLLLTGGTDKNLEFTEWAKTVKKIVKPENLFLLEGSATRKMEQGLRSRGYGKGNKEQGNIKTFIDLQSMLLAVRDVLEKKSVKKYCVLFSPGAASFEKFKNEFDRGEKFNALAGRTLEKALK